MMIWWNPVELAKLRCCTLKIESEAGSSWRLVFTLRFWRPAIISFVLSCLRSHPVTTSPSPAIHVSGENHEFTPLQRSLYSLLKHRDKASIDTAGIVHRWVTSSKQCDSLSSDSHSPFCCKCIYSWPRFYSCHLFASQSEQTNKLQWSYIRLFLVPASFRPHLSLPSLLPGIGKWRG